MKAARQGVCDMKVRFGKDSFFAALFLASIYAKNERCLMAESLVDLERQRAAIFRRFAEIGGFRRGSITPTSGKCGKPSCHCAQPNDPGHGPNFRLTRKVSGKSATETFSSRPPCGRPNGK